MGKKLKDMTQEEREAAVGRARDALQKELRDNAAAIGRVMDEAFADEPPNYEPEDDDSAEVFAEAAADVAQNGDPYEGLYDGLYGEEV